MQQVTDDAAWEANYPASFKATFKPEFFMIAGDLTYTEEHETLCTTAANNKYRN